MGQRVQMVRGTTWYGKESPDGERDNMVWDRVQMVRGTTWSETESPDGERNNMVWDRVSRW